MTKKELLARIEALEMRLYLLEAERYTPPIMPWAPSVPGILPNVWYSGDTGSPLPARPSSTCLVV